MANLVRIGFRSLLLPKNDINLLRPISSKAIRSRNPEVGKKPAPWPYQTKPYNLLNFLFDKTSARLDENSKVVVVEGPIAAGKSKFAKELANELDMLYFPEANLDMIYTNSYGFNMKQLDDQLPLSCRSFDVKDFLTTPKHLNTAAFQIKQYTVKFKQYIDALAHVLSTGQGVVLDRCCYSDFVFAEAMASQGFISKEAKKKYYEFRDNTIQELLRPHLVIYLDVPVKKVQENIQKRAIQCEMNSPALSECYLTIFDKFYKQYLKEINRHAELLVYDWSDGGEVEIIVEDIERIDFSRHDEHDPRMADWVCSREEDWAILRNKYADRKHYIMGYFNIPVHHVPELTIDAEDAKIYHDVMNNAPGQVYETGYNQDMGDTGLLFKTKGPHRETLPFIERNLV